MFRGILERLDVQGAVTFDVGEVLFRLNVVVAKAEVLEVLVKFFLNGVSNNLAKAADETLHDSIVAALDVKIVPCISDFFVRCILRVVWHV